MKLATARGPFDAVDVSLCRTERKLLLKPPAVISIKQLSTHPSTMALRAKLCKGLPTSVTDEKSPPVASNVAEQIRCAAGRSRTSVANPLDIVGKSISKFFPGQPAGQGWFTGKIISYDTDEKWYKVKYEDGDTDEFTRDAVLTHIRKFAAREQN